MLAWQKLVQSLQPRQPLRRGLIGTGGGTVEVSGRPTWVWIRYEEEENRLSMVRCYLSYPEEGTPVIVGKFHPEDDFEQVLGVYWGPYSFSITDTEYVYYRVARHGESHHGTYGSDPAWIDYANFVFGRVSPTDPASMIVNIGTFVYPDGPETKDYDGGSVDLTSEVPAGAGHKYILIYYDIDAEAIAYESSATVPLAVSPEMPVLDSVNAIPLAVVRLYNGQTEITIDETWQRKLMLGYTGGAKQVLERVMVYDGHVVTHDGEVVWDI